MNKARMATAKATAFQCAADLMKRHHECQKTRNLAADEMGTAFLPSPSQQGCGASYDPAALNTADFHARNGNPLDAVQCGHLAAQSICGISGFDDPDALKVQPFDFRAGDQKGREAQRHSCFCSFTEACSAQAMPLFEQRVLPLRPPPPSRPPKGAAGAQELQ